MPCKTPPDLPDLRRISGAIVRLSTGSFVTFGLEALANNETYSSSGQDDESKDPSASTNRLPNGLTQMKYGHSVQVPVRQFPVDRACLWQNRTVHRA